MAAPEEDNGCSSPAAERALAQLTGQICLPPRFWLGFHCRAVKSSLCEVKSLRILLPQAPCLGEGLVLLKLGEIQRRTPVASWEREKLL